MARRRLTSRQQERIKSSQEARRERSQRRAGREVESLEENGLGPERPGRVIANFGPAVVVEAGGDLERCAVRQNLGALAAGDRVVWRAAVHGGGVVVAVEPRRSLLSRPDYSGRLRPVAANLDQVGVVVAPRPTLNEFLIDRYLVAIHAIVGVEPLIILNKVDLLDEAEQAEIDARLETYRRIGYSLLHASTKTAHGLTEVRRRLADRTSVLVGQSGVGKSSLVNALLPGRDIRTQALSQATGMGTHTTTTATLYPLPDGGELIDSPGVRSFELSQELTLADLERGFPEFAPYLGRCRFSNCAHTNDPGCALQEAASRREIDPRRLESYHQLRPGLKSSP